MSKALGIPALYLLKLVSVVLTIALGKLVFIHRERPVFSAQQVRIKVLRQIVKSRKLWSMNSFFVHKRDFHFHLASDVLDSSVSQLVFHSYKSLVLPREFW